MMMTDEHPAFRIDWCDPGIRDLVARLRDAGYQTTDSGDGVSKPDVGRVLDIPHVFIRLGNDEDLGHRARCLMGKMESWGYRAADGWHVEATYSTADGIAMLAALGPPPRRETERPLCLRGASIAIVLNLSGVLARFPEATVDRHDGEGGTLSPGGIVAYSKVESGLPRLAKMGVLQRASIGHYRPGPRWEEAVALATASRAVRGGR